MATARMVWDFEPGIRTLPLRLDGCISMRIGNILIDNYCPRGSKTHRNLFYTLPRHYKRVFLPNLDTNCIHITIVSWMKVPKCKSKAVQGPRSKPHDLWGLICVAWEQPGFIGCIYL